MKKKWSSIIFFVIILAIVGWGLIIPKGIRGAMANNAWSIANMNQFYAKTSMFHRVESPPATHAHAPIFLAIQAIAEGDIDAAEKYITPLVEVSDPLALNTYAQILFDRGDYLAAIAVWEKQANRRALVKAAGEIAEEHPDISIEAYKSLVRIDPRKYTIDLAIRLRNQSRFDDTVVLLQHSIENYPDAPHYALWIRYMGDVYVQQQKYPQAEAAYRQAMIADPTEYKAWRNLGLIYYGSTDRVAEAIPLFQKLVEIDPQDLYALQLLADAYERTGQKAKAIETYRRMLAIDPENSRALEGIKRLSY